MVYLAAALCAAVGVSVRASSWLTAGIALLGVGALVHGAAMWRIHARDPVPQVTDLPFAVSVMAWIGTLAFLALLPFVRGRGLAVAVAPLSFLGVVFAALGFESRMVVTDPHPFWSHVHVLLASGGLAVLGIAGAAGILYLVHHAALKSKRRGSPHSALPSLETLDRVNALSLALGFLLLSLGLLTGVLWVDARGGELWASRHAVATLLAWVTYAAIVVVRFARPRTARSSAAGSAAAFGILVVAVIGIEVLA